jgi:hypothetical protein
MEPWHEPWPARSPHWPLRRAAVLAHPPGSASPVLHNSAASARAPPSVASKPATKEALAGVSQALAGSWLGRPTMRREPRVPARTGFECSAQPPSAGARGSTSRNRRARGRVVALARRGAVPHENVSTYPPFPGEAILINREQMQLYKYKLRIICIILERFSEGRPDAKLCAMLRTLCSARPPPDVLLGHLPSQGSRRRLEAAAGGGPAPRWLRLPGVWRFRPTGCPPYPSLILGGHPPVREPHQPMPS